ncbi:MAG: prenyltransferase/squalene oxidase repeat-containing protein [Planctomycetota bacterium]
MARRQQEEETYEEEPQEEYVEEEESKGLNEMLGNTPYWLMSLFCHSMIFVIGSLAAYGTTVVNEKTEIKVSLHQEEEKPFVEELKRDVFEETKPIKEDETPIKDPVVSDAEVSDHNETDNNEEFAQAKGTESALSDKPFDNNTSFTDAIGVGGGGGGTFGGRFGGKRNLVKAGGGGQATESAVLAGLIWLKNHQDPKGNWDADNFMAQCKGSTCSGTGKEWTDMGQTGLALLAFLGAGNTHRVGRFKDQVRDALKYMKDAQTPDGCFGPQEKGTHYMYNHTIATLSMVEAYEVSGKSPLLKAPAQSGVDYLTNSQNPGLAWRYEPQSGDNDSSVSGWAVMALKSAKIAELHIPPEAFEGAKNWYDSVTDDSYYRAGYMKRGDPGARLAGLEGKFAPAEAMTAVAMTARVFMGEDPTKSPYIKGGAQLLSQNLPEWDDGGGNGESKIDFYYWYYGTLAMFQVGGESWKAWNGKMKKALVESQKTKGCENGSWDPICAWSAEGGRVYGVSTNVLSLEIYYRYAKVFK